jgi:hypothetical protein
MARSRHEQCRLTLDPICALQYDHTAGRRVVVQIPDGVQVSIVGPCGVDGMVEITDGDSRYAVFTCDLLDRSQETRDPNGSER